MQYRKLGRWGLKVSAVSLGSWRTFGQSVDDAVTEECLRTAYDKGINFFDGAEAYGNGAAESAMGRVLGKTGWPRDTFCISSKVYHGGNKPNQSGLSRKHIIEACDAALQRFGTDYLDLYFCHRPDPDTPLDETVHAMNELVARGKILYWGTSNFSATDLLQMHAIAERDGITGPAMEQPRYNMLDRDRIDKELKPLFTRYGMGTTVYSPLAVGILTGKYNDGIPADSALAGNQWLKKGGANESIAKARRLSDIARELQITTAQLALAWCLKNPHVSTVITGASRAQQVEENAAAADCLDLLDDALMKRIENAMKENE